MEESYCAGAPPMAVRMIPLPHPYSNFGNASTGSGSISMGVGASGGGGGGGGEGSLVLMNGTDDGRTWMDSRIWRRLPERLVDRIIACLPPPAFFRARAVCKRWYGLIFSPAFLDLYLQLVVSSPPPTNPTPTRHTWFLFFFMTQRNSKITCNSIHTTTTTTTNIINNNNNNASWENGYLLDPHSLKWYRLSFPLIPQGFSPASSSGGLLCWVSEDAKTVLLSNPLLLQLQYVQVLRQQANININNNNSNNNNNMPPGGRLPPGLIQLPPTLKPRLCPSVGLAITDSSIDLTFAGDDMISPYAVKNLTSETFHIDAGGFYSIWGTTAFLPRLCSLERMVHVGGRFYCMNYSPFSVLAYDMSANHWTKIQAPMRRFLRSPTLVETRGRLVMVAAVEKSKLNVPKSLRMWTLQEKETTDACSWVEIERMPQQLYFQFADMECGRGFDCVAHGDFLVLLLKSGSSNTQAPLLLFDFSTKRWAWIPPCPYPRGNDELLLHGFAYEPRLAVPITPLLEQLTLPFHSFTN